MASKKREPDEKKKLAKEVFELMRKGNSAHKACQKVGLPQSTFNLWMNGDKDMAEEYARAREDLIELIAEETIAIADAPVGSTDNGSTDSGAVAKQRLQVDTRKWLLSKLAPKKFGDKVEQTHIGPDGGPVQNKITVVFGE